MWSLNFIFSLVSPSGFVLQQSPWEWFCWKMLTWHDVDVIDRLECWPSQNSLSDSQFLIHIGTASLAKPMKHRIIWGQWSDLFMVLSQYEVTHKEKNSTGHSGLQTKRSVDTVELPPRGVQLRGPGRTWPSLYCAERMLHSETLGPCRQHRSPLGREASA